MTETLTKKEKMKILRALESDLEFRYAVAGYLGLAEILKRLDRLEEGQNRLWEEVRALRESQNRLWEEVKALREGQERLWENQNRLWEEVKALREGQERLWENQNRLWEEVKALREGQERLWENQNRLWEEVKLLREGQNKLWETVNRLSVTVERLTITVEEEGLDVVRHRLKNELGVDVSLGRLFAEGVGEVDMYGVSGDLCVVGEATVRLGEGLVDELDRKVELLKIRKPELLRPKLIKVIYVDYATPGALDRAREKGVWVLKWSGDLTPVRVHELK